MKTGLTTSLALHAVALGFGLVSLSSPRPMEVAAVESFPVLTFDRPGTDT